MNEINVTEINRFAELCHQRSTAAGWWKPNANIAEKLCLIHSEISEAMEGYRKGLMDDHLPHRLMIEVELADAIDPHWRSGGGAESGLGRRYRG